MDLSVFFEFDMLLSQCVFVFVWCSFFTFFKASLQFSCIICTIGFCLASRRIVINKQIFGGFMFSDNFALKITFTLKC